MNQHKDTERMRAFREKLLSLFDEYYGLEKDMNHSIPDGVAWAGATKDLLLSLGMEWSHDQQKYIFPKE